MRYFLNTSLTSDSGYVYHTFSRRTVKHATHKTCLQVIRNYFSVFHNRSCEVVLSQDLSRGFHSSGLHSLEGAQYLLHHNLDFWDSMSLEAHVSSQHAECTCIQRAPGNTEKAAAAEAGEWLWVAVFGLVQMIDQAEQDRKSTRLNSSHSGESRMPSSA